MRLDSTSRQRQPGVRLSRWALGPYRPPKSNQFQVIDRVNLGCAGYLSSPSKTRRYCFAVSVPLPNHGPCPGFFTPSPHKAYFRLCTMSFPFHVLFPPYPNPSHHTITTPVSLPLLVRLTVSHIPNNVYVPSSISPDTRLSSASHMHLSLKSTHLPASHVQMADLPGP